MTSDLTTTPAESIGVSTEDAAAAARAIATRLAAVEEWGAAQLDEISGILMAAGLARLDDDGMFAVADAAPADLAPFPTDCQCTHCGSGLLLVEGGYERTWDIERAAEWDPVPVATFTGLEDYSDDGDGAYRVRCRTCLTGFELPAEWDWN